jgi:hypothetical protein
MKETVKVTEKHNEEPLIQENRKSMFPSQMVELPSKGLVYDLDNPLSKGFVEIKYMTAKEEDILTTESYIKTGVVLDKLLQSLVVDPLVVRVYDQLLTGDRNALLIAARKYGYGEIYNFETDSPSGNKMQVSVNLDDLKSKPLFDETIFKNANRFSFKLPIGGQYLEFRLLTIGDDKQITERLKKYKTANGRDLQLTERLIKMIIAVDGAEEPIANKLFVENMLAKDSRAFREYVSKIQPNVDMEIDLIDEETGDSFRTPVTLGSSFFWPEL